jgi:hypothetical protein
MYKVHLFQYKSQFNTVFNINPGNQGSPIIFILISVYVSPVHTLHEIYIKFKYIPQKWFNDRKTGLSHKISIWLSCNWLKTFSDIVYA